MPILCVTLPFSKSRSLAATSKSVDCHVINASLPAWNVHHPWEELHKVSAGKSCSRHAYSTIADGLGARIQLRDNQGVVIRDGHDHGCSSSVKMLFPFRWLGKEVRGEENCFGKLWRFERLDGIGEPFMGSLAHLTPPALQSEWGLEIA